MAKINNKEIYALEDLPSLLDYLIGSKDKIGKTRNFSLQSVIQLINGVNGKNNIQYQFSDGTDDEIDYFTNGMFFTNNNQTAVGDYTELFFNKSTILPIDLTDLFNKLGELNNVVLKLENPENPNNFFNFKVVSFQDNTDYFVFGVQDFNGLFLGELINTQIYSIYFDIKSATNEEDKFTSVGTISLNENEISFSLGFGWEINGGDYANTAIYTETIPFSSLGMQRFVLFVGNVFNTFEMISGLESVSNPVAPPVPNNTIQSTLLLVTDGTISNPEPPDLSGYATKDELNNAIALEAQNRANADDDINNRIDSTENSITNLEETKADTTYVDSKVSGLYKFKGSVDNYAALPSSGQSVGDVWNLTDTSMNYVWTGSVWDPLGSTVDVSGKEDTENKKNTISGNESSTTFFGTIKAWIDWLKDGFASIVPAKSSVWVDADLIVGFDSADGNKTKTRTWAQIKANLASIFFLDATSSIQTQLNGKGDMTTNSAQTVSAVKTFLSGTFGLRNVANTFTLNFTNAITAARTIVFPDKNGTLAIDSEVMHLAGNETFTGTKSFNVSSAGNIPALNITSNTGSSNGILITASGTSTAIQINASNSNNAIRIDNTGAGSGINVQGASGNGTCIAVATGATGTGVNVGSNGTGNNINVANNGGGTCINVTATNAGSKGIVASAAAGITLTASNSGSSGIALFQNSSGSTGIGLRIDNATTATGKPFQYTKNAVEKAFLDNNGVIMAQVFRLTGYTVSTLPTGTVGDTAYVTDALAPTYLGVVVGGGLVTCKVFHNGANWIT